MLVGVLLAGERGVCLSSPVASFFLALRFWGEVRTIFSSVPEAGWGVDIWPVCDAKKARETEGAIGLGQLFSLPTALQMLWYR